MILRTGSKQLEAGPRIDGSLAGLPGLTIWDDEGGALARRFGVRTSGHVLLYDSKGRLLYSGGITPARGHRGDNLRPRRGAGRAVRQGSRQSSTPAFGCPLFESRPEPAAEARP